MQPVRCCPQVRAKGGGEVCPGGGEFTSPSGGIKPPLRQTAPLPNEIRKVGDER